MQTQPNGWQYFVSTLLIVTGAINVIQGLAAMFTPDFYIASETQMLVLEYGAWGVLLGLWGWCWSSPVWRSSPAAPGPGPSPSSWPP